MPPPDPARVCRFCMYWFNYTCPPPTRPEEIAAAEKWRVCNHPTVSAKGLAPLKTADDTCAKFARGSLMRPAETVDGSQKPPHRSKVMPKGFV